METKFTKMEELVIQSICKQAEILADDAHYDKVNETLNKLIDLQVIILSGKIDIIHALNILKKAKEVINNN